MASLFAAAALMATGLFVAAVAPSAGIARGVGAILFYLMMFFAGLWLPISGMPPALQHISHATPLGAAVPAMQNATLGALAGRAAAGDHGGLRGGVRTGRYQAVPLGVKSLGGEDR